MMNECFEFIYRLKCILFLDVHFDRDRIEREKAEKTVYFLHVYKMSWINRLLWHNAFKIVFFFVRNKLFGGCRCTGIQGLKVFFFVRNDTFYGILEWCFQFYGNISFTKKDLKHWCNSFFCDEISVASLNCKINFQNSTNRWIVTRANAYESPHNQLDTFMRFIYYEFYLMSNNRSDLTKRKVKKETTKKQLTKELKKLYEATHCLSFADTVLSLNQKA